MTTPAAPPSLLSPCFDTMPPDLRALPQWVVWKGVWLPDRGKYSKVPYNARSGQNASSTDPATWSDFETARRAYEHGKGRFAGVGFVMSPDDPFCGVDLDHAVDGMALHEWAGGFLTLLDSYAEVSPSGTGLRVFLRGDLPPAGRKRGDVEMYDDARFLTVTGRHWPGTPTTINDRQEQIDELRRQIWPPKPPREHRPATGSGAAGLDDRALLDKAFAAANGPKLRALYDGSTAGYLGHSEADLALCSGLAFWTGPDADWLDRLFRGSGLMRNKWDEARGPLTYGERTIQKALEGVTEFYSPPVGRFDVREAEAVQRAAGREVDAATPPPNAPAPEDVPAPDLKGEYAPYQIAALLGFPEGVAADTNKAHAERIQRHLGERIAHCPQLGGWRWYNGKCWPGDATNAPTVTAHVARLSPVVREESARLYALAGVLARAGRTEDSEAMAKAARLHLKHAAKVESTAFIRDTLVQAAGLLRAEAARFEPVPWVIGFDNGVWDRGEWREHRPADGFRSVCPVSYEPGADRSEWRALLDRMTGGDADLARTLQDVAGYVLSGASTLRTIPWAYGPRGCGKSTFAELLMTALGDMGRTLDPSLLAEDAARERLGAAIFGARLVSVAEAGNRRIGSEVLKTLSGADTFPARFLYAEQFNAKPSHVVLMVANDPPRMDAYDDALRERVMALPLNHSLADPEPLRFSDGRRIEEVRRNPHSALLRGFTAWAVEGLARVWETQEIHRAACIEAANEQFWRDTDPLGDFWEAVAVDDLRRGVAKGALRKRYEDWCEEQGIRRPLGARDWARSCKSANLSEQRDKSGNRLWVLHGPSLFHEGAGGETEEDGPLIPPTPEDVPLTTVDYGDLIRAAVEDAVSGRMPDGGEVALPSGVITRPAAFVKAACRTMAELKERYGEQWREQPDGDTAATNLEALAVWWHQAREEGSPGP